MIVTLAALRRPTSERRGVVCDRGEHVSVVLGRSRVRALVRSVYPCGCGCGLMRVRVEIPVRDVLLPELDKPS